MKKVRYKSWNWEFDYGQNTPAAIRTSDDTYADAYFDGWGRLIQVVGDSGAGIYDYVCDEQGRVLEKRSLNADGSVCMIVRYSYDDLAGILTETAWWYDHAETKHHQRPIPNDGWRRHFPLV